MKIVIFRVYVFIWSPKSEQPSFRKPPTMYTFMDVPLEKNACTVYTANLLHGVHWMHSMHRKKHLLAKECLWQNWYIFPKISVKMA